MKRKPDIQSQRERDLPLAERFVRATLVSVLGLAPETPVEIRPASGGGKSIMYLVSRIGQGEDPAVQPGCAAIQKFDRASAPERDRLVAALELAAREDAPTPRLICAQRPSFFRPNAFVAITFAPGRPVGSPPSPAEGEALAQTLTQLHAIGRERPGKPGDTRTPAGGIAAWAADSARSTISALQKSELDPAATSAIRSTLESQLAKATRTLDASPEPSTETYQLCHGHLAPDDVLFDERTGAATIIDCSSLEFSRAARDLASVRLEFFGAESQEWERWLERYLELAPPGFGPMIHNELPFFTAWSLARKIRRALEKGADPQLRLAAWNSIFRNDAAGSTSSS